MASEPKSQPFLKGLSLDEIAALVRIATRVQYKPGETILRQRETADRFFLIEKGRVSLDYELPRQRRVQIQEIGPGEALGWSWLSKPYKWQFTATAIDRVTASVLRVADLRKLFARDPALGYAMMERAAQALLERLQATRHKLRVYVRRASGDENTQQVC
ncbi:MAG: Crp/Fnr family transcriptional regulator [Chthoniobacterales bacterium]